MIHFNGQTIQNVSVKRIQFEGREHLVAPVVLMVEGVHRGSGGPLYYSANEIQSSAHLWNGVPLPIHHPEQNGQPISCNSPDVIQSQSVGRLWNVQYESSPVPRLKGEIYVDVLKAQQISPATLEYLNSNRPLEVSTGLFSDDEMVTGTWNEETYNGIVRNIRPDHLALLPGAVGACSWQDGCGVRANKGGNMKVNTVDEKEQIWNLRNNDMGMEEKMQKIRRAIYAMDGPTCDNMVQEIYDDYVVYECRPGPQSSPGTPTKTYKRSYSIDANGGCALGEEMEEVRREINYVPVSNVEAKDTSVDNTSKKKSKTNKKEGVQMERTEKVNLLIQNGAFTEDDREFLTNMDCPQFSRIEGLAQRPVKANEQKVEPVTFEQLLANAPADVKAQHEFVKRQMQQNRDGWIGRIKANASNKLSDDQLKGLSDDVLQSMADSFTPVANYEGGSGSQTVVTSKEEIDMLPTINEQWKESETKK